MNRPSTAIRSNSLSSMRALLDSWVDRGEVAALQYLLVRDGELWLEHCAGQSDVAESRPVGPQTTFNLYSLTKPFTATLVLSLAQQRHLQLDDPIARATGLHGLARLGSIGETLLHRAGFANPMPLRWFHLADEDARFDEGAFVTRVLASQSARAPCSPRYSNPGYLALGVAAERAVGWPFRQALTDGVLAPLRLAWDQHLAFTPPTLEAHACGHFRRYSLMDFALRCFVERERIVAGKSGRWVRMHPHHVDGSAYGGLIGNARALVQFGEAVLGLREGIDPTVRSQLLRSAPGPGPARTYAFFRGALENQPWLAHAGGGLGAYGELRLYPESSTVSALLTNRPGLRDEKLLDRLDVLWARADPHYHLPQ